MPFYEVERFGAGPGTAYDIKGPLRDGEFSGPIKGEEHTLKIQRDVVLLDGKPTQPPIIFDPEKKFGRTRKVIVDVPLPEAQDHRKPLFSYQQARAQYQQALKIVGIEDPMEDVFHKIAYIAIGLLSK